MLSEYEEQLPRLTHARKNAALEIATDSISPNQVLNQALDFLKNE
jgi:hypothetical protein